MNGCLDELGNFEQKNFTFQNAKFFYILQQQTLWKSNQKLFNGSNYLLFPLRNANNLDGGVALLVMTIFVLLQKQVRNLHAWEIQEALWFAKTETVQLLQEWLAGETNAVPHRRNLGSLLRSLISWIGLKLIW